MHKGLIEVYNVFQFTIGTVHVWEGDSSIKCVCVFFFLNLFEIKRVFDTIP